MKTYEKNGLKYVYSEHTTNTNTELFVTAKSIYKKLKYYKKNYPTWLKRHFTKKYENIFENYFYDVREGLCIHVQIADEALYNCVANSDRCRYIADLISSESHDFFQQKKWKETPVESPVEDQTEKYTMNHDTGILTVHKDNPITVDLNLYKEKIQPKISAALKDIKPKKLSGIDFELFELPDQLTINGKKYISEESVQKEFVEANMKLEAMKTMLLS